MLIHGFDKETEPVIKLENFYGFELFNFLEAGDVLEESGYDTKDLHGANHNIQKLHIALEVLKRI